MICLVNLGQFHCLMVYLREKKYFVEEEAIPIFATTLTSGDLSTAQLQDVLHLE